MLLILFLFTAAACGFVAGVRMSEPAHRRAYARVIEQRIIADLRAAHRELHPEAYTE